MSWQLNCYDMCKIVAWSDDYNSKKTNINVTEFRLQAHKSFVKLVPGWAQGIQSSLKHMATTDEIAFNIYHLHH